jgi:hypothetical protein
MAQMRDRRLVADQAARAVAQHCLFFGEDESHEMNPMNVVSIRSVVVMPGLVPGIHVFSWHGDERRRGWPGIGERKRRRSSNGYARP